MLNYFWVQVGWAFQATLLFKFTGPVHHCERVDTFWQILDCNFLFIIISKSDWLWIFKNHCPFVKWSLSRRLLMTEVCLSEYLCLLHCHIPHLSCFCVQMGQWQFCSSSFVYFFFQEMFITELQAETTYSVTVTAYTTKGDGARSKPKLITTTGAGNISIRKQICNSAKTLILKDNSIRT